MAESKQVIHCQVPSALKRELSRAARERDQSITVIVRRALESWLKNNGHKKGD